MSALSRVLTRDLIQITRRIKNKEKTREDFNAILDELEDNLELYVGIIATSSEPSDPHLEEAIDEMCRSVRLGPQSIQRLRPGVRELVQRACTCQPASGESCQSESGPEKHTADLKPIIGGGKKATL